MASQAILDELVKAYEKLYKLEVESWTKEFWSGLDEIDAEEILDSILEKIRTGYQPIVRKKYNRNGERANINRPLDISVSRYKARRSGKSIFGGDRN
jgi:hypothetical protein